MIKIFNKRMDYIGLLESFNSFSCSAKYADKGTFSIKALLTKENKKLLQVGNFVQYKDFAGIINTIQYSDSGVDTLIASGQDLVGLLDKRVIWTNEFFDGNTEGFLRKIVTDNAINPSNPKRKIPFLVLGKENGLPQTTVRNTKNETLFHECQKVCKVADYGFTIGFNPNAKKLEFQVYEGSDRTVGKPNQVILGNDYDNVTNHDYIYSNQEDVTTCLVSAETTSVTVGDEAEGFDRTEVAIGSVTLQDTLTPEEYAKVLTSEGNEALIKTAQCFDVDVAANINLNLGDMVTVREADWNISFNKRITEKQMVVQNGAEIVTFLLGDDIILEVK